MACPTLREETEWVEAGWNTLVGVTPTASAKPHRLLTPQLPCSPPPLLPCTLALLTSGHMGRATQQNGSS